MVPIPTPASGPGSAPPSPVVVDVGRHVHAWWTLIPDAIPADAADDERRVDARPGRYVSLEELADTIEHQAAYVGEGLRAIDEANVARAVDEALSDPG